MSDNLQPIDHPGAWRASELNRETLTVYLTARHLASLDAALSCVHEKQIPVESITRDDFPINDITDSINAWIAQVQDGYGMIILSGFPVDKYTREEMGILHFGIGAHFGTAMSQSVMGDRLGHVINVGGKDPKERAYRNSMELAMHTDACDIVAMMCLQKAAIGGYSGYVSAMAIYNEVLARNPALMPVLLEGFHYHRFGEELPGQSPVTEDKIPVFSFKDGYMSINYLRSYIEMGAEELGVELSRDEVSALDLIDDIAHDETFALKFITQPGEAVFFNNLTILHNRTSFEDSDIESEKRHLLRLWLVAHDPRPTAETLRIYEGQGIPKQSGKTTYFKGDINISSNKNREFRM